MYPNDFDAIQFLDVVNRIPPNINGYMANISEVNVIENNNQKLPLLTLTGTADNVNFELKKFLKYELRTGSVLYNLLKAIHRLPQKGEYAYISDLIGSLVRIYVEDRLDNEGNTISYVKKIEPYNGAPEPMIPLNRNSENSSQDDEQDSDEEDYEDGDYEEDECDDETDEENSSDNQIPEKPSVPSRTVSSPPRTGLKPLPPPIPKPRPQKLPQAEIE